LAPASLVRLGRIISPPYCLVLIVVSIKFNDPARTFDPMLRHHHQFRSLDLIQKVMKSLKKLAWPFEFTSVQCTFNMYKKPNVRVG
jgi:hypothetical protein